MLEVKIEGRWGKITGRWNHALVDVIRGMPGFKKWKDYTVQFELTAANLEYLKSALMESTWSAEADAKVAEIVGKRDIEERTRKAKVDALPAEAYKFPYKTKPMEHQARGFMLSREQKAFGIFAEMGTGKTKLLIDSAAYQYSRGNIDMLLVCAPNGVHRQWINEQIPQHCPDWCNPKGAFYESGMSKKRRQELDDVIYYKDGLKVIAINIEALSHKSGEQFLELMLKLNRCYWVIDESTRISKPGSRRTKSALRLAPKAHFRRIASGAPITKGTEDLYTQLMFLDPDILGYSSFYTFRNRYCIMGGWEGKKIVAYKNLEELQHRLDGWTFRVMKEDCLDLPPKVYMQRMVQLTDEQRKIYDEIKTDFVTTLDSGAVFDAPLAITRLMRLQQIVCGHLPDPDNPGKWMAIGKSNPRIDALFEILEDSQGKVIIWARFVADIELIGQALRKAEIGFVEYHGSVDNDGRTEAVRAFREDAHVRVFLGQPASGGIGLNLTVATMMVYYSNDFNADVRWQSEDRAHRIGQTQSVTYIDLVAEKTVDAKIIKALQAKKSVADTVLDKHEAILDI